MVQSNNHPNRSKAIKKLRAIERGVLAGRYSVYFDNGQELFITAKSNEAAERKACRRVPGVRVRFSLALCAGQFLRTL